MWCGGTNYNRTLVRKGASIGAERDCRVGTTIGPYHLIGSGSVVALHIPDYALVYGNPARVRGWICACGFAIEFIKHGNEETARCAACGARYTKAGQQILAAGPTEAR